MTKRFGYANISENNDSQSCRGPRILAMFNHAPLRKPTLPMRGFVLGRLKMEKPEVVEEKHLEYLDELRDSGITNMFGAGSYLQNAFDVDEKDASAILSYWMDTFSDRHPA